MTSPSENVGICFNNFLGHSQSVRGCIFSLFSPLCRGFCSCSHRFPLWPWPVLTVIVTITLTIRCPYENRLWLCGMSQVFTVCCLTYSNLLIRNPSAGPPCNGGFWPAEFKRFCLYSWCFLAWLSETSCLFDASSVHANVPLDNASQLIHSFHWHAGTHTQTHTHMRAQFDLYKPGDMETPSQ